MWISGRGSFLALPPPWWVLFLVSFLNCYTVLTSAFNFANFKAVFRDTGLEKCMVWNQMVRVQEFFCAYIFFPSLSDSLSTCVYSCYFSLVYECSCIFHYHRLFVRYRGNENMQKTTCYEIKCCFSYKLSLEFTFKKVNLGNFIVCFCKIRLCKKKIV